MIVAFSFSSSLVVFILTVTFCSRQGDFTIIPVLVGSLTADKEQRYGRIFAKYLADPENLFVISSDFCHWGKLIYIK